MAKRIRDADLETRAARSKLKARGKPYYRSVGQGLHVGYRKGKRHGMWVVRRYTGAGSYGVETIAEADDFADADGKSVLTFWQAQEQARKSSHIKSRGGASYTIKDAVDDYLQELEGRASYNDTKLRLGAYAVPSLGNTPVHGLQRFSGDGIATLRKPLNGFAPSGARRSNRHARSTSPTLKQLAVAKYRLTAFLAY
jgi:hypothetical protein